MVIPTTKKTVKKKAAPKTTASVTQAAAPKAAAPKKKAATKSANPATSKMGATRQERWKMVAVAAYYKALARGFAPGHDQQDWLDAEREIDAFLS